MKLSDIAVIVILFIIAQVVVIYLAPLIIIVIIVAGDYFLYRTYVARKGYVEKGRKALLSRSIAFLNLNSVQ